MKKRILALAMAISVSFTSVDLDAPLLVRADEIAAVETTDDEAYENTEASEMTENLETEEIESDAVTLPEMTENPETKTEEEEAETVETEESETEEETTETVETEESETEEEATETVETETEEEVTETVETETEEIEEAETEEVLLNYVMVESAYIETPGTQNIVVSAGGEDTGLEKLVLLYTNTTTGRKYEQAATAQYEDVALFTMDFTDETAAGAYELTGVSCVLGDTEYELLLADAQIEAKFGVNMEVDTAPDEVFYEEEDLAEIEANVVTMDESGNVISENTVEDVLDEGLSLQSAIKGVANGNTVVVLDPGHDDTHAGAQKNGAGEEDLVLKIATYCKEELDTYQGVTVYMTRSGGPCPYGGGAVASATCNEKRVEYAKSVGASVYVSFHLNSSSYSTANGVGVYYPNSNYNVTAGQIGNGLANKVYEKLTALGLSKWSSGVMSWNAVNDKYADGSAADYLGVIRNSKKAGIPAILIEHAFISGTNDYNNFLSSDEKLKALGVADAEAIAEYYGLSKKTSVPEIKYIQAKTGGKLKIVWSASDGVSCYELWRSTSKNSGYSLVENVEDTNSYTDDSLTAGKKYYYKVRAVYAGGSTSNWSEAASGRALTQVKLTSVLPKGPKSIALTWEEVTGADGYYVYRKNGESYDKLAIIALGNQTTYVDTVDKNNTEYSYKVQAYNTDYGKTGVGSLSAAKSGKAIAKPTMQSILSENQTTLKVSWKKVSGADGYVLQRATSKNGKFTTIKTINSGNTTTYSDSTVTKNKTYYYRVQAFVKTDGKKGYSGYGTVLSGKTLVKTKISSIVSKNETTLTIQWNKVSGASGYTIQRSTSKNGTYKTVKTIKSGSTISYDNTGLKAGQTYYYKVQAYTGSGDNKGYSGYCSAVAGKTAKKTTIIYVVSSGSSALKLAWQEIAGAYGYRVKRSTSKNGTYETLATVKGDDNVTYTDKKRKAGQTYYYKIETINKVNGNKGYSGDSKAVSGTVLGTTTITKAKENNSTSMTLTWKKVSGADGYQVYRSTSKYGSYTKTATVKGNAAVTYKDTKLSAGKTYYYKVRAYHTSGTKTGIGTFSEVVKTWTIKQPVITKVSDTAKGKVTLTWDKVSKASGYYIYRSTKSNSGFEKIAEIAKNSTVKYTDGTAKTGRKYYYKIAALNNITGNTMGRSDYSEVVGVALLKAPTLQTATTATGTTISVQWNTVANAAGYQLYYSTTPEGSYKKLTSGNITSYTHTGLSEGSVYYYKVRAYDKLADGSNVYSAWSAEQKVAAAYAIMGKSKLTVAAMADYYESKNYTYPTEVYTDKGASTPKEFFTILKEEAEAEGVKTEVLFAQVMLETGGLQFGGIVKAEQCNFGGIGATDDEGNRQVCEFKDVRTGLRAQTQHLKAYASKEALKNECVDTRFAYVTRECAPYVQWLSIPNNPYGKGWATDMYYAPKLFAIMEAVNII